MGSRPSTTFRTTWGCPAGDGPAGPERPARAGWSSSRTRRGARAHRDPHRLPRLRDHQPGRPGLERMPSVRAIPVQMSCHVRGARGALVHHEFLAEGPGDPRPAIAEAVVEACEGAKTVVAYNASFEKALPGAPGGGRPGPAKALRDVIRTTRGPAAHRPRPRLPPGVRRLVQPEERRAGTRARCGYGDLDIGEGGTAQAVLEGLLLRQEAIPVAERRSLRKQLLAYCERDTLAMVKLLDRLGEVSA